MKKKTSIKIWISRYFAIILILVVVLSALVNLRENITANMHDCENTAKIYSENITSLLNNECDLEGIKDSAKEEIFIEAREVFQEMCKSSQMDYIYVYTILPEVPARYYYLCAGLDRTKDEIALEKFSLRERKTSALLPGEEDLLSGSRNLTREYMEDEYGKRITWLYPYYDENGKFRAIIGMDYSINRLYGDVWVHFLQDIIPFVLLVLLSMLFLLFLLQRRIVSPIRIISDSMKRFAHDSHKKQESLEIRRRDEIGEIADSFEKMTGDISSYINNIETLTREKLENDVQLGIARRIQHGMVPEELYLEDNGFEISASTHPAKAIGGDFYDFFRRGDGNVCIVMGDVSGKGISAAICMAMVKTVIKEKMILGLTPAETLNRTNEEFSARNPENMFVTVFAAELDLATGQLIYANAGHTYPVFLSEEPRYLDPEIGIALGLFEDADITDSSMTLMPGEGILLYTDGVTEAINPERKFFGKERLLDAVRDFSGEKDAAKETVRKVEQSVKGFCGDNESFDDMAVLSLVYRGRSMQELPIDASAFDRIKEDVIALAGDEPETRRALMACEEALINIVSYSGATELSYSCEMRDGRLCVSYSDNGIPFDQTAAKAEEKEFDSLDTGGMGLNLIRQTAESLNYERRNERNLLTLNFTLK